MYGTEVLNTEYIVRYTDEQAPIIGGNGIKNNIQEQTFQEDPPPSTL